MAREPEILLADDARGGVVLLSEIGGVDDDLRAYAGRLVEEGYSVVLPDLWWRQGGAPPTDTPEARAAAFALLVDGLLLRDIAAARDLLDPALPRFLLGFCIGGLLARTAACATPGWAGAVEFYGRLVYAGTTDAHPIQPLDLLPGLSCPYLGHFGEQDAVCPPHHIDELRRRLGFVCQSTQVLTYAGCGHAFMNAARPTWDEAASRLAWQRTLRFFDNLAP